MQELFLFPKLCLPSLDKLGLCYEIKEETSTLFCTILVRVEDYDTIFDLGLKGHSKLLKGGN